MGKIKPQALLQQSKKKKGPARISISAAIFCNLVVILILLSLYAAFRHFYPRALVENEINENEMFGTTAGKRSMKFELPMHATFNTTVGSISMELYKDAEPGVVDMFLNLCKDGHFEGAHFYPVLNNRVLQVAKIQKYGSAKDWMPKIKNNIHLATRAMDEAVELVAGKTSKEDAKGFELFISRSPVADFNDKFTVFGKLLNGGIIQAVEQGENNMKTDVSIQSCLTESRLSA